MSGLRTNTRHLAAGDRFGLLVLLTVTGKSRHGDVWQCACDCGQQKEVATPNLRNGSTRSCGCIKSEANRHRPLNELLAYDALTGRLKWLVARGAVKVGDEAGGVKGNGYVYVNINGKACLAHRLAWNLTYGEEPAGLIDHINGDRTDNRIANLRVVTASENSQNLRRCRRDNETTGLLGVCKPKRSKKFVAQIQLDGQRSHLGYFTDKHDAHEAYLSAKRRLHPKGTI